MSSSWWEQVTSHLSHGVRREGAHEVWAERTLPQGLIAALMGTIQERLYPNKEITRSMLRTGHWESFIRSLDHELQMMLLKSRTVLRAPSSVTTALREAHADAILPHAQSKAASNRLFCRWSSSMSDCTATPSLFVRCKSVCGVLSK